MPSALTMRRHDAHAASRGRHDQLVVGVSSDAAIRSAASRATCGMTWGVQVGGDGRPGVAQAVAADLRLDVGSQRQARVRARRSCERIRPPPRPVEPRVGAAIGTGACRAHDLRRCRLDGASLDPFRDEPTASDSTHRQERSCVDDPLAMRATSLRHHVPYRFLDEVGTSDP
jgi:hypothetical protein